MRLLYVQPNGIGNTILSTPAMQAVRNVFPSAHYDVLIGSAGREVVAGWEVFDGTYSQVEELPGSDAYDLAVFAEPRDSVLCAKLESRVAQMVCHPNAHFFTHAVRPRLKHEVVINMEVAEQLGFSGPYPALYTAIAADRPEFERFRGKIAVHMGAAGSAWAAKKQWPQARWIELIRRLGPLNTFIVGGPDELVAAETVADATGSPHVCGKHSVPETARIIANSRLLISTDSGVMHIAAAVGTPLICLFGGTSAAKNRPWGPIGKAIVLQSGLLCAPCQYTPRHKTCADYRCMHATSVNRVMAAASDMEKRRNTTPADHTAHSREVRGSRGIQHVVYDLTSAISSKVGKLYRGYRNRPNSPPVERV